MMLCIRTKNLTCVLDEYHVYYIGIVNTTSQQEYILLLYRREGEYPSYYTEVLLQPFYVGGGLK